MPRVFLLEDEPDYVKIVKVRLSAISGRAVEPVLAEDLASAKEILQAAPPGSLFPLIFDLSVPASPTGGLRDPEDWENGLQAIEAAWNAGHHDGIAVLSRRTEERAVLKATQRLSDVGIRLDKWLNKSEDLKTNEHWESHFVEWFEDLAELKQRLFAHWKLSVVHPLQLTLLKTLLSRIRDAGRTDTTELPAVLLTGHFGDGKSAWAKAMCDIKAFALGRRVTDPLPPFAPFSLASVGAFDTNAAVKLFGARNWTDGRGKVLFSDGVFVQASEYSMWNRPKIIAADLPPQAVDRKASGIAFLDEFLSTPPELHDALLDTLSSGFVVPEGIDSIRYPVGCTVVAASHVPLEGALSPEGAELSRGKVSGALLSRFGAPIQVPALQDMSVEVACEVCEQRGTPVAASARLLLEDAFSRGMLTFRALTEMIKHAKGPRLTEDVVRESFPAGVSGHDGGDHPVSPPVGFAPTHLTRLHDGPRVNLAGLPDILTESRFREATAAWSEISDSKGAVISNRLFDAGPRFDLAPSGVLALIIVAFAAYQVRDISEKHFCEWLGISRITELRGKLRDWSRQNPSLAIGSGRSKDRLGRKISCVTMVDLQGWTAIWLKHQPSHESCE